MVPMYHLPCESYIWEDFIEIQDFYVIYVEKMNF